MNLLTRVEFLPAFLARLNDEPDAVVAEFESFRDASASLFSSCSLEGGTDLNLAISY
jgi:hypothetical protein